MQDSGMSEFIIYAVCFLMALFLVAGIWRYRLLKWFLVFAVLASFLTRFDWVKSVIR